MNILTHISLYIFVTIYSGKHACIQKWQCRSLSAHISKCLDLTKWLFNMAVTTYISTCSIEDFCFLHILTKT